jgi:NTE family protein
METSMIIDRNSSNDEPITLMLLGGGIRFPAFIGALKAIEEKGLNVRKIVGSSTGSIVGSLYASGMSPEELQRETLATDTNRFKDFSLKSLYAGKGLYEGKVLESWLDEKLKGLKFSDDFRIPPHVIATDILNYKPIVFSAKTFPDLKVATAARFSTGVPWVYGYRQFTYKEKKHVFIDGTLMSGLVEESFSKQEKTLVLKVVSKRTLNHPPSNSLTLKKYFLEMLTFSMHAIEKEFIKGGKWKNTILLYCADIAPAKFSLSENEKGYLFDQGYEQTMKYLEYKWGI